MIRTSTSTTARTSYVVAGLVALVPLIALAYTEPLGNTWEWLEYPSKVTMLAAALGIWTCFARTPGAVIRIPILTAAIVLAAELISEYHGLSKYGRTELFSTELGLLIHLSLGRIAPWGMAALYALLAVLAITTPKQRSPLPRAGAWLVIVGALAAIVPLVEDNWEDFAKMDGSTVISGGMWNDSRTFALVAALVVVALGLAAIIAPRFAKPKIPPARVIER